MATIKQNAEKLRDVVLREKEVAGSSFIDDLRAAAARAIRAGVGSAEWEHIMRIFADNPRQLEVLNARDDEPTLKGLEYAGVVAAYLAGGIMCTSETVVHLPQSIGTQIDVDLPSDGPAPEFEKFPFPQPALPVAPVSPEDPGSNP